MAIQANPYPLRINKDLMNKFKVIASENGRSVNKEIEFIIKRVVSEYETKNGPINVQLPSEETKS